MFAILSYLDNDYRIMINHERIINGKLNSQRISPDRMFLRLQYRINADRAGKKPTDLHGSCPENHSYPHRLRVLKKESKDERNFVKKAVNWALRQIGKRNKKLNRQAVKIAKEIQKINSKSAKWIADNALKELQEEAIQKRFKKY